MSGQDGKWDLSPVTPDNRLSAHTAEFFLR